MAGKRKGRRSRRKCRIYYPTVEALLYAVERLRRIYPEDHIHVAVRAALEDAVSAARFAAAFTRGSCREKKLAAAATLFYEIIARHPLRDGNKRLAATMLAAFMRKNSLKAPRPGGVWRVAVRVAAGEWGPEEVKRWLQRIQHG
ncbi:Fic family protein [Pyrodictium abyssi]|uniref:Fido domain-containing protein n=1 Tax=Pyrodictium abyssi TaxID=54256 RepID=A0ABN6ZUV6_9CREN|nr:hypothetical protein PABY_23150 [Pyrodictium abyssi]